MLRVLGRASSINVRKVLWTCAEIGLPFEREDWGSGFRSPNEPAFTALNPNAMIPVVIEGHFVLWESNTICRWLAAEQGRDDLLPSAPRERALVERCMDWTAPVTSTRHGAIKEIRIPGIKEKSSSLIKDDLVEAFKKLISVIDFTNGGTKGAPKFPMPSIYQFLLTYLFHTKNPIALEAVSTTLDKIANGGIYDHSGGGFARYSTD